MNNQNSIQHTQKAMLLNEIYLTWHKNLNFDNVYLVKSILNMV